MNDATRDAVLRRTADGVVSILAQRKHDRAVLQRMDELISGVALRALLIYGLTGVLSGLFGTLLGHMIWRALSS